MSDDHHREHKKGKGKDKEKKSNKESSVRNI